VVAGCYVTEGKIVRGSRARLVRDGTVVYTGRIDTLKRFKDDVREVAAGFECGMTLDDFNDIKEGDVIEAFEVRELPRD
jgi:translation initiation factor IF-2